MTARLRIAFASFLSLLFVAPAHAEWREATSEHFIIQSGGSEEQLVRLSQQLEALHWLLGRATGVVPAERGPRVRIYMVDRIDDVQRAAGVSSGSGVAGFYRPTQEGAYAVVPRRTEDAAWILFHEYAHHYMLQYLPGAYPPWYVEGFAEVLGTTQFDRPGEITYGAVAHNRSLELTQLPWVPLRRMMARPDPDDRTIGAASYGQYWLVAHYFTFSDQRRGQLRAFMQAMLRTQDAEQAAAAAFPGGLAAVDSDIRNYMRANRFQYQRLTIPPEVARQPTVRVMRAGEAAVVPEELQALRPMSAEAHVPIAQRVAAMAQRFPHDPAVALLEARLWRFAERFPEAGAAIDRALALNGADPLILTLKGQIMLEGASVGDAVPDAALVREARAYIVRANRADPENQIPLIAYYESFGHAGERPSDAAVDGLLKASQLVPQDPALRMSTVREMIDRGEMRVARELLAPLAFSAHRSARQRYALVLLEWIEAGAEGNRPEPTEPIDDDDDEEDDD